MSNIYTLQSRALTGSYMTFEHIGWMQCSGGFWVCEIVMVDGECLN
jgi:hypothetical protein